jgi:hypothetical protein
MKNQKTKQDSKRRRAKGKEQKTKQNKAKNQTCKTDRKPVFFVCV